MTLMAREFLMVTPMLMRPARKARVKKVKSKSVHGMAQAQQLGVAEKGPAEGTFAISVAGIPWPCRRVADACYPQLGGGKSKELAGQAGEWAGARAHRC